MAKNIVYLLGAGASANAIPVMKKLPKAMKYFLERLIFSLRDNSKLSELIEERRQDFNHLLAEIQQFGTPDIVAKIALHKGEDQKVLDLKNLLTCYILSEQLNPDLIQAMDGIGNEWYDKTKSEVFDPTDKLEEYLIPKQLDNRYVELFSAILTNPGKITSLPENVSILSWNYDHQLEKALSIFYKPGMFLVQEKFGIFPKTNLSYSGMTEVDILYNPRTPQIIKLNGTAGFGHNEKPIHSIIDATLHDDNQEILEMMAKVIFDRRFNGDKINHLSFAWEETALARASRTIAHKKIKEGTAVVVIGYSFPNFNREVDRQIFESFDLRNSKLYIQDPYPDEIIEKLDGVKKGLKKAAVPVPSGGSLTIPNEFWE